MEKQTNWLVFGGVIGVLALGASAFSGSGAPSPSVNTIVTPVKTTESSQVESKDWALPTKNGNTKAVASEKTNEITKQEPVVSEKVPVTKPVETSSCHPSYSGCLKQNAGDYDCASGSGNGPNYTGAVQVNGSDPFDLDRDNDGWGCE